MISQPIRVWLKQSSNLKASRTRERLRHITLALGEDASRFLRWLFKGANQTKMLHCIDQRWFHRLWRHLMIWWIKVPSTFNLWIETALFTKTKLKVNLMLPHHLQYMLDPKPHSWKLKIIITGLIRIQFHLKLLVVKKSYVQTLDRRKILRRFYPSITIKVL